MRIEKFEYKTQSILPWVQWFDPKSRSYKYASGEILSKIYCGFYATYTGCPTDIASSL